ncbi:MAG TPA: peptidase S41 [Saprospirales bacterium]|nr:peptidase S41 [Saprospirales bacterium]
MHTKFLYIFFAIIMSGALGNSCGLNKKNAVDAAQSTINSKPAGKISIVHKLTEHDSLPIAGRIALYYQLKKEQPELYDFTNETEITMYGYRALWDNKVYEAIEIFKLIVAEFPDSYNAYDSLGEAYMVNDNTDLAIRNYETSLTMNPDNFNAEDQLERINFPHKKPETPAEKFTKVYTAAQYREDLDQLAKKLLKVHPNALKFISKEAFEQLVEQKKQLMTDRTTYAEFFWHCGEIMASVNCSHTRISYFSEENEMLPLKYRFPLETRIFDNRLYVIDPLNNAGKVKERDEILSINGVPTATLVQNIYRHLPAQGYVQTTKRHEFNMWSACLIPYALGFAEKYEVVLSGQARAVVLNQAEKHHGPFRNKSLKVCPDELCLDLLGDGKSAVLSITTFNFYPWNNLSVFQRFIDSTFQVIREKNIRNLVIDVRFNGGGSQHASIHLLRYLMDKPFVYYSRSEFAGKKEKIYGEESFTPFNNRFKGKLWFVQDGLGQSTTGHFMSLVKRHKLGPIIGEELGSNQFCSAGQTMCRLPNTKITFGVADNTHVSNAPSFPDEKGILPDYEVYQTVDDYFGKVDAVKAFALAMVGKGGR